MTSLYSTNYSLRPHKRDAFIEFMKSLLLTPFILHTRPRSTRSGSFSRSSIIGSGGDDSKSLDNGEGRSHKLYRTLTYGSLGAIENVEDRNYVRYVEVLECVESLVVDHILHQNSGFPEMSRLKQLVPTIGRFFTPLPLREAFMAVNKKRSIVSRRFVPPSFNDIRHLLNLAQVTAIAPNLKLISFDGDMTLYADGADFARDSELVDLIVGLLRNNIAVAIVTAAGYPGDAARYEQRLSGLLDGIRESDLTDELKAKFYLLGGECNYLFLFDPKTQHLVYVPEETYQPASVKEWSVASQRIKDLLDMGEACATEACVDMGIMDRVKIIRKERAVGIIAANHSLSREQLDELALGIQRVLNNYQHAKLFAKQSRILKAQIEGTADVDMQEDDEEVFQAVPFCAFNGGSDVWLDVGNKLIGVKILQDYLGTAGHETLHVGDQFLSTGNDILTRSCAATVWITSPAETADVLTDLHVKLKLRTLPKE